MKPLKAVILATLLIGAVIGCPAKRTYYPKYKVKTTRNAVKKTVTNDTILTVDTIPQAVQDSIRMASLMVPDSLISAQYASTRMLFRPKVFGGYERVRQFNIQNDFQFKPSMLAPDSIQEISLMEPDIPDWLIAGIRAGLMTEDLEYAYMVNHPESIDYAYWDLPVPPRLPEEDKSFRGFLKRQKLPKISLDDVVIPPMELERRYWLHYFNVALQLSQAYVSSNWYQGGNDYIAVLFNTNWNVELNTVFKPNLLFQSSFQYKLGISSNPKGSLHRYSMSQDLLQYNLKTGVKAFNHWFYSFNLLFNTQLFNAYEEDTMTMTSALLSPGTLNLGLGMTYNFQNQKKTFKVSASISPLAYNLKTCINKNVDPVQFNIKPGHKTVSEIGSSGEMNMELFFTSNISWKSRLFLFTDYNYFLGEWENTFNFQLNKLLSTQIYLYPRYDTSAERNGSKWKHWMFKEILSFGISYVFSTK